VALSPVINLPVRSQVLGVDVESIAPHKGFASDAFDVANVNGVLVVENPYDQEVRLVLPFPIEEASGEVRVVSTGERKEFRKRDGRGEQFVELLRSMGEIPPDQEPVLKEVIAVIKDFRIAASAPRSSPRYPVRQRRPSSQAAPRPSPSGPSTAGCGGTIPR
jgi:hypothetical protein